MANITWHGAEILAEIRGAQVRGVTVAAEHLLQVSRSEVPIEEATLERSGTATVDADARKAAVAYDTPYAAVQHEDLTLRHDGGRKAKFLEDPANAERQTMLELLAAETRRAFR